MKYTVEAFMIRCITNMHVGTGGSNYDIISNMVQRDVCTNMPTIYSSSLKGALREFFSNQWAGKETHEDLNYIFGADPQRKKEGKNTNNDSTMSDVGHYNFFQAHLLSLPIRARKRPFYNATSQFLIEPINKMATDFNLRTFLNEVPAEVERGKPKVSELEGDIIEDWKAEGSLNFNEKLIGEHIALLNHQDFMRFAEKLPVIARNQLDNGLSQNLFYEELVPSESRFVFFVARDDNDMIYKKFEQTLTSSVVQIGANGSIGYGFCKISKIEKACCTKTK